MNGDQPEQCDECGFDATRWRIRDAVTVLDALGFWWRLATDGVATDDLNRRPDSDVWSALEYGAHSSLVTAMLRTGLELILDDDGVALPPVPELDASDAGPVTLDAADVLAGLTREGKALGLLAKRAAPDAWAHVGTLDGDTLHAEAVLLHAVHDATHHQMDVGRGLAAIGVGTPRSAGSVAQVNVSDGGVPKRAVARAAVGFDGLEGDRQADRKHHGRPFQALCLWSSEVIAELAAGHSIEAGAAGENVTLTGIAWDTLRPGARLRIGTALAEVSYPSTPCAKQTRWFSDGDFSRIDHDRNPGWTRWYAWVREPGIVQTGDAVSVSDPPA